MATGVADAAHRQIGMRLGERREEGDAPGSAADVVTPLRAQEQLAGRRRLVDDCRGACVGAVDDQDRQQIRNVRFRHAVFGAFRPTVFCAYVGDHPANAVIERHRGQDPNGTACGLGVEHQLRHRGEPGRRPHRLRPGERDVDHDQLVDPERGSTRAKSDPVGVSGAPLRLVGSREQGFVVGCRVDRHGARSISGSGS